MLAFVMAFALGVVPAFALLCGHCGFTGEDLAVQEQEAASCHAPSSTDSASVLTAIAAPELPSDWLPGCCELDPADGALQRPTLRPVQELVSPSSSLQLNLGPAWSHGWASARTASALLHEVLANPSTPSLFVLHEALLI